MQNAIDFRELRRRERRRMQSSNKTNSKSSSNVIGVGVDIGYGAKNDGSTARPDVQVNTDNVVQEGLSAPTQSLSSSSIDGVCAPNIASSLEPYESLLPRNKLSNDLHRIKSSPRVIDSVFYAQNFLSREQGQEIMFWLQSIPECSSCTDGRVIQSEREQSIQHNGKWTTLKHAKRKVALFDGMICELPAILQRIANTLVVVGAFPPSHPPNHVLINEYQQGEGIMPHTDGPAYESCTATISLGGSDVIFKLWPRQQHNDDAQLLQSNTSIESMKKVPSLEVILHGNGSLVVFKDDAYLNHCHEISEGIFKETTSPNGVCGNDINGGTLVKRGYRVSLTFRHKK